jgi:hypothetical protein
MHHTLWVHSCTKVLYVHSEVQILLSGVSDCWIALTWANLHSREDSKLAVFSWPSFLLVNDTGSVKYTRHYIIARRITRGRYNIDNIREKSLDSWYSVIPYVQLVPKVMHWMFKRQKKKKKKRQDKQPSEILLKMVHFSNLATCLAPNEPS